MSEILESGDVFFFYRPRVGKEEVRGLEDVQRLFLVLAPDGERRLRRLIVGRKRLPDPRGHERVWAFVAGVADRPEELREEIEPKRYETQTRGERLVPGARPAGEGRYAIVRHDDHTHLAYVLELPPEPGEAQRTLGVEREASYVVAVRNPEAAAPPGAGLPPRRRPEYPAPLRERFGGRRFTALDPPALLDHEGAELVLIGASDDVSAELGIDLDEEAERSERADLFERLRPRADEVPLEPLERGELR